MILGITIRRFYRSTVDSLTFFNCWDFLASLDCGPVAQDFHLSWSDTSRSFRLSKFFFTSLCNVIICLYDILYFNMMSILLLFAHSSSGSDQVLLCVAFDATMSITAFFVIVIYYCLLIFLRIHL